ncbi:hypothetical protein [Ichthyenterobacterium magnum]|uniref:Uncharacterized protein n=1 Tax=Ichthyenterobacterium magnum TaxID=1230530 RepID=A0A420DUW2_9FLAO|nr:hypothetical protein [Ichthyenterobacterium magnum]RKE97950.1 hypothetical protein BXY80_0015 [Ichthyenterobacterium magnum]
MKSKIKQLIKIGILYLVMILAQTSCEKNNNSIDDELQQEKKASKVSFSDFNTNVTHNRQYQNLERHFDISKNYNQNLQNRISANDSITLLTDEILLIQKNDISYYTFKIVAPSEHNEFYNLVVHVNNQQQIIKSEIYEYTPDDDWLIETSQPYSGFVKVIDNDFISLDDLFSARAMQQCLTGASGEWECNLGNNHAPGEGQSCTSWDFIITLEYGRCPDQGFGPELYLDNTLTDPSVPNSGGGGSPTIPTETFNFLKEECIADIANELGLSINDSDCLSNNSSFSEACSLSNDISNYLANNQVSSNPNGGLGFSINSLEAIAIAKEFVEIRCGLPEAKLERFLELKEILNNNPWALVQECAEQNGLNTNNYLDLYNLPFPQECSDRLFNMGVEWHHQPITDGNVPLANIDYYGVEVNNYPDFDNDGNPDSEAEIYQAFREKFIDVASGDLEDFQFSCNVPFNSTNNGDINWEFIPLTTQDGIDFVSNDPIASILLIEADASGFFPSIATDDGAVIVSDFTNNDWTISTIMTANNGTQPFSGNRQWGWLINQNGNFEFFTRAVDVANISLLLNIGASTECQQDTYYNIAEATWENMQQEIVDWINSTESNGGQASIIPKTAIRVDKEKIEELLTSNETINQINCD